MTNSVKINCGKSFFTTAFLPIMLGSCGAADAIKEAVKQGTGTVQSAVQTTANELDRSIAQLQTTSTSWQQVLGELQGRLTSDARNLINTDLQNLTSRTIGRAGVEFRCDADFVNHRVAEGLINIKAKIMGQAQTPPIPRLCQAVPEAIEVAQIAASVPTLTFYGYNLDLNEHLKLTLFDRNGVPRDITRAVNTPTTYAMTVTLGQSGAALDAQSERMVLSWNGEDLSRIAVIPPHVDPVICKTEEKSTTEQEIGPYIPLKVRTGGDDEFHGNGPDVSAGAKATFTPDVVQVALRLLAKETKKDFTQVDGSQIYTVYRAPAGYAIEAILTGTESAMTTTMSGTRIVANPEQFDMGGGELVKYFQIVGDTDGNDVGKTRVRAALNPITVRLVQKQGCVPALALSSLIKSNVVSPFLVQKMRTRIDGAMTRINRDAARFRVGGQ